MRFSSDHANFSRPQSAISTRGLRGARWVLRVAPVAVFAAIVLLYTGRSPAVRTIMNFWAIHPPVDHPFLDLRYIFAGAECWAKGIDVYIANPCDPLGRPHGYSPLWLRFAFLPGQQWTTVAGLVVDGLFVLALAALPPLQRWCELPIRLLAILSPPVIFALQRANVDVIMFLMLLGAAGLWVRLLPHRIAGYALILAAGLLKFYPLIVLATALRERTRVCVMVGAAAGGTLLGFAIYFRSELHAMAANIPTGGYLVGDMFGAKNLPYGLASILGLPESSWFKIVAGAVLAASCAVAMLTLSRWNALRSAVAGLASFEAALLLFGAVVFVGCFVTGQSVGYRGIHLLLVLPGLLALWRGAADTCVKHFARSATFLVLFLMWQGALTWNDSFLTALQAWFGASAGAGLWAGLWLIRELGWWALAAALGGIFLGFAREAPAVSRLFAGG
ncbi:MAG: hypothetical protein KGI43_01570 [Alphaproteobacteria bacterium]|nr:hypothetical protein [Alphaproteobacteria bacterium]